MSFSSQGNFFFYYSFPNKQKNAFLFSRNVSFGILSCVITCMFLIIENVYIVLVWLNCGSHCKKKKKIPTSSHSYLLWKTVKALGLMVFLSSSHTITTSSLLYSYDRCFRRNAFNLTLLSKCLIWTIHHYGMIFLHSLKFLSKKPQWEIFKFFAEDWISYSFIIRQKCEGSCVTQICVLSENHIF